MWLINSNIIGRNFQGIFGFRINDISISIHDHDKDKRIIPKCLINGKFLEKKIKITLLSYFKKEVILSMPGI